MGFGAKVTSRKQSCEKMAAKTAGSGAMPPEPAMQLFSVAPDMSPARPLF
jgi:hypothetical protein